MAYDRRLIPILVTLLMVPLAVVGAVLGALQTPRVQQWLADRIAQAMPVRLQGFRIEWPLNLWADQLTLVDGGGPWAVATHLRLDWSPAPLLGDRLHIRVLAAERLEVLRRPQEQGGGARPPRLPVLPIDIRVDGLSVDGLVLDAAVYGVAGEGRVSAAGRLAGGRLSLAVLLAGDAAGARGTARLGLDGAGASLSLVGQGDLHELPAGLPVRTARWSLAGNADLRHGGANIGHFRIDTDRGRGSAFGWVHGRGEDLRLHLAADLPDLSDLAPELKGQVHLDGDLAGSLRNLRLAARISSRGLATGLGDADRLMGASPQLSLAATLGQGLRPGLFRLAVVGPGGRAQLGGLARQPLFVGARLRVEEAADLTGGRYAGWVQAEGMVVGSLSDPLLAARGETAGQWDRRPIKATLLAAVRHLSDAPLGQARLDLSAAGIDAQADGAFQWGPVIRLDKLAATSGGDRIAGDIAWYRADGGLDGRLRGRIAALSRWAALAGLGGLDGAAGFDLSLARHGTEEARLTVDGRRLSYGGLTIRTLTGEANLRDLFGSPRGAGTVELAGMDSGKLHADRLRLETAGDLRRLTLKAAGSGRQPTRFTLDAAGSVEPKAGRYEVTALDGVLARDRFHLLSAARLSLASGQMQLSPTRFAFGGGNLRVAGSLAGGKLDGVLGFQALPVSLLTPLFPDLTPTGLADGQVTLGGTPKAPTVAARINGRQLDLGGHHAGVDAAFDARWDGQRLRGRLTATGLKGSRFVADGDLPLSYAGGRVSLPDGPVKARLEGRGDLARLAELLPLGDQTVAGQLAMSATVGGTVEHPDVDGHLSVTRGIYQNFDSGLTLSGIALTADGRDSRHVTVHAEGGDGAKGRFTADGSADLTQGPSFRAEARLEDLRLVNLDMIRASGSGLLHFDGAGTQGTLSGTLDANSGEVDISQALPARIVTLKVVEINRPGAPPVKPPGQGDEQPSRAPAEAPFQLAFAVDAGLRGILVRGRGLDSEWKGHLKVGGSVSRTTLLGRLSVVRGTYDLFGQQLKLTEGSVNFDGEHPPDPRIDIIAEGQSTGITAQVHVTGTAERPELAFTSDPPMPKDEILSRLLFGTGAGQLSVMQQLTLARAAAGQIGGGEGGGFDPIGKLRNFLGLDVLQAGGDTSNDLTAPGLPSVPASGVPGTTTPPVAGQQTSASTKSIGPSLSAGKYLNSRTFLRVDQGTTGGRVTVEVELGGGFAVDTRLGEDAGGGVGVSWKKDY